MCDVDEASIQERVAAGADWLDVNAPGWEERIYLPAFNIKNVYDCVLGQVFAREADYDNTSGFDYVVDGNNDNIFLTAEKAIELGFDMHPRGGVNEYAQLQAEWTRVISSR